MRETIKEGVSGFLVDSLEEMVHLIRNNACGSLDRNKCREWVVDNFSLERMIARYDELCTEAVNTGGW